MGVHRAIKLLPFVAGDGAWSTFSLISVVRARIRLTITLAFAVLCLAVDRFPGVHLPLAPLLLVLLFEAAVNQPYGLLLRLLGSTRRLYFLNITFDILAIAAAGYFLGGLENQFLGLVFVVAIALIGATGGRLYAYWAASVSTGVYVAWAVLARLSLSEPVPGSPMQTANPDYPLIVVVNGFTFFLLAYFVAIPAQRLREDIRRRQQAEAEVQRLNEELEGRVRERTAELETANRELEAFSYSVSHDLRAPLRSLDGFSRILLAEYGAELPVEAQHYLATIRQSAQMMGHLVDDLLALSRYTRQPLAKRSVDVAQLVAETLETLRADLEGRDVQICVGGLPGCLADPGLLRQVFVNLLSNAVKFTRQKAPAKIEVGSLPPDPTSPDKVVYFVRDNGAGFDMRYADKLFGVFQRLHRAEEYEGTGVGLAIVDRIVRRHGGRVWAEAEPEHGATFYVALEAEHGDGSEPGRDPSGGGQPARRRASRVRVSAQSAHVSLARRS
jgi:signal transduction histidine kinase